MADLPANLSSDQLTDFRENWIRDKYVASPYVAMSEYNKSRKENFFSDPQLQSIYDRVVEDWAEELDAVQEDKEVERLALGDEAATAITKGDQVREQAVYRLMRIVCRRQMLDDPGFRASLTVAKGNLDAVLNQWNQANREDVQWVRSRSGEFAGGEIERE